MRILWLFIIVALLGGLQSALFRRVGLRALTYRRSFGTPHVFEGQQTELVEVLENRSLLPLPWLRAESRMSPALRFGTQPTEAHTVSGDMYHSSVFFLPGLSRRIRRYPLTATRRGCFSAATVSLTCGDLLGMQTSDALQLDTGAVLEVFPRLMAEADLPALCRRFLGEVLVRRFIHPDPFLISGARAYRQGDSPRDIDWRATARMGELQVHTYDFSADPCLLVVLNVQRTEGQWADLSADELAVTEADVSLAASLCLAALNRGAEIGFAANTDTLAQEGQCVWLPPMRSQAQAEALLSLFARLTLRRAANFYTFLERLAPPADADILILSHYHSQRIDQAIAGLRAGGHQVMLQSLSGGDAHDVA